LFGKRKYKLGRDYLKPYVLQALDRSLLDHVTRLKNIIRYDLMMARLLER